MVERMGLAQSTRDHRVGRESQSPTLRPTRSVTPPAHGRPGPGQQDALHGGRGVGAELHGDAEIFHDTSIPHQQVSGAEIPGGVEEVL